MLTALSVILLLWFVDENLLEDRPLIFLLALC